MNWDAIGAIGEIIGAVAVLATLAYLARQIKQSNKIGIATSETALRNSAGALNFALCNNAEMASIFAKTKSPNPEFDEVEETRLEAFIRQLLNAWIAMEAAYENEMAPEETFNVIFDNAKEMIENYPGARYMYRQLIDTYPAMSGTKIFSYLDAELKRLGC